MNAYNQAERLIEIIENAGGEDLFAYKDGVLSSTVHTGKTIEAFDLRIEFPHDTVLITTRSFLGVEEHNYDRMRVLLESLNELVNNGIFFIDEDNTISFLTICEFEDIIRACNPFDIVFSGCEPFGVFSEAILKTLAGNHVYYVNNLM